MHQSLGPAPAPCDGVVRALVALFVAHLLAFGIAACQASPSDGGSAAGEAPADSASAEGAAAPEDSARADTARDQKKGGGLFGFLKRGRGGGEDRDEDPAIPVELVTVVHRQMSDYFATTATIEAEKEATVLAKARGQVIRLLVEEGDRVEAGTPLAQLDDAEYQARVGHARVRAANMEREFQRAASMFEKGLVSERAFAEARYNKELSESELDLAQINLDDTRVVAPFTGIVTGRHIDLGENAVEGTPLFDLADVDPLLVNVYMPEREVAKIHLEQPALVEPDAAPGVVLPGQVQRIAPRVDTRTGTVKVTLELDGSSRHARPGSFVRVQIQTDVRARALAIPKRAVVHEAGDSFVFCAPADADTVTRLSVELGYENGEFIEVVRGLEHGDRVVRVGQGALKEGSRYVEVPAEGEELAGDSAVDEPGDTAMAHD